MSERDSSGPDRINDAAPEQESNETPVEQEKQAGPIVTEHEAKSIEGVPLSSRATRVASRVASARTAFLESTPDLAFLDIEPVHPALPDSVLPEKLGALVVQLAGAVNTDPAYLLTSALPTLAAAIGTSAHLQINPGLCEPTILWGLNVGSPSTGKSESFKVTAQCLLDMAVERASAGRRERRFSELVAREQELRARRTIRAAVAAGEIPSAFLMPEAEESSAVAYTTSEPSLVSILELLERQPRGLLVQQPEITALLGSSMMRTGDGRGVLLTAYDGGPYQKDRHDFSISVPALALSVCGATPPDRLPTVIGRADDGLFARFLTAWPVVPYRDGLPQRSNAPPRSLRPLIERLLAPPAARGCFGGKAVTLSAHGREAIEAAMRRWRVPVEAYTGVLQGVYQRAHQKALRIALVIEIAEHALEGKEGFPRSVDEGMVRRAVTLMDKLFLPSAARALGHVAAVRDPDEILRALSRHIVRNLRGGVFNRRALSKAPGAPSSSRTELLALLDRLEAYGCVARAPSRQGESGRLNSDYVVHPAFVAAVNGMAG